MNKKIAAIIAAMAVFAMSAVSCGKDAAEDSAAPELPSLTSEKETVTEAPTEETTEPETEPETKAVTTTTAEEEATEAVTTEASEETTEAPEEPTEAENNDGGDNNNNEEPQSGGVSFDFADLNGNAASKIAALGTPNSYDTVQGCLSNGADQKVYRYDGLEIQCYILNGTEYIYSVFFNDSRYATSKGIKVGSSRYEVETAYGDGEKQGNYVYYYDGDSEIDFEFDGDTVVSIEFYTSV